MDLQEYTIIWIEYRVCPDGDGHIDSWLANSGYEFISAKSIQHAARSYDDKDGDIIAVIPGYITPSMGDELE